MTQYARPDADISDGDWLNQSDSNTNLYASIDESSASDSDYIKATDEGYGSGSDIVCIIGLSEINTPDGDADHKIKYRASDDTGSGAMSLKVELLEGSTVRKTNTNSSLTSSLATYTINLTTSEASNISDYTNLRLRFTANDSSGSGATCTVSWAEFQAPDAASGIVTSPAFLLFVDF